MPMKSKEEPRHVSALDEPVFCPWCYREYKEVVLLDEFIRQEKDKEKHDSFKLSPTTCPECGGVFEMFREAFIVHQWSSYGVEAPMEKKSIPDYLVKAFHDAGFNVVEKQQPMSRQSWWQVQHPKTQTIVGMFKDDNSYYIIGHSCMRVNKFLMETIRDIIDWSVFVWKNISNKLEDRKILEVVKEAEEIRTLMQLSSSILKYAPTEI